MSNISYDTLVYAQHVLEKDVLPELARATELHGAFHSAHEGYAVLLEEVEELWDAIKEHQTTNKIERHNEMRKVAVQVVAMALRFLVDVC